MTICAAVRAARCGSFPEDVDYREQRLHHHFQDHRHGQQQDRG
jgi:hypothetical protein